MVTEGLVLRPFASERPFVSFVYRRWSPKVLVFKLVLLSDPSSPSGTLTLFLLEPCKRVREYFRGWELDPEVQSPTVAPRGQGPKPTVETLDNEEDCAQPSGSSRGKNISRTVGCNGRFLLYTCRALIAPLGLPSPRFYRWNCSFSPPI